jgi:hypothetical protein
MRNEEKTFRMFLLGAGFSKAAGLPLASELFAEVLKVARSNFSVDGSSHLENELGRYKTYMRDTAPNEEFNFENFGAWLDWDHTLQMKGSDTFSEIGSEATLQLKWAIGKVLQQSTPKSLPSCYLEFARQLNTSDIVLTLNYDLILENALRVVGTPFRRFPDRFAKVFETYAEIDSDQPEEVQIYKLHGSLDWTYLWGEGIKRLEGVYSLVKGPRAPDDPLNQIGVIPESVIESYYSKSSSWWHSPPLLFPPSAAKPLARSPLVPLWRGIGVYAAWRGGFSMIGCSLPSGDPYVKQLVHHIATEYAQAQKKNRMWWPQGRMKVIDLKVEDTEKLAFKKYLRFFDTGSTDFYLDGFSEAAVRFLYDDDDREKSNITELEQ